MINYSGWNPTCLAEQLTTGGPYFVISSARLGVGLEQSKHRQAAFGGESQSFVKK